MNIYYGNETLNKEKFILEHVDSSRKTIIIVPDQYSLQMEQDALAHFEEAEGKKSLLNLMVADFSSLGRKVVREAGGREPELIDKYGRHMLLSLIVGDLAEKGELRAYRRMAGKTSFTRLVNQQISEMKRYGVSPAEMESAAEAADSFLGVKLKDMTCIFNAYEDAIEGRFTDTEDYMGFYGDLMGKSDLVRGSVIWVYGFDTFTPLNLKLMGKLLRTADEFNVVITWEDVEDSRRMKEMAATVEGEASAVGLVTAAGADSGDGGDVTGDARILTTGGGEGLFDLTGIVIENLKKIAAEAGREAELIPIEGPFKNSIWSDSIEENETQVVNQMAMADNKTQTTDQTAGAGFGRPADAAEPGELADAEGLGVVEAASHITLAETSGIYDEAERVAAHIVELTRDKGYSYSDITLICNDMDVRGAVLQRTLERWDIPVFADRKRKVLHQPVVRFLLSLLDIIASGYESSRIMEMVGAGLMDFGTVDEELLSNYVNEAVIRGFGWKKEFTWTGADGRHQRYSDEELNTLNEMRKSVVSLIDDARNEMGRRNTAGEKVKGLYEFLENRFRIREKIQELISRQVEIGLKEGAAEAAQSWKMICELFTQITRIVGESRITNIQLKDLIAAGLEEMEIGIVPTNNDCVVLGTLQRTRVSRTRSLIVAGANEGILPLQAVRDGLLTEAELERLEEMKLCIAKKEEVRMGEEQLAIYRMFSLPSEDLFVSCSLADQDGKSIGESSVFSALKEMEAVSVLRDLSRSAPEDKIVSRKGTLPYMTDAMRNSAQTGRIDSQWLEAAEWYEKNDPLSLRKIKKGLDFDNRMEHLEGELADSLYFGDRDAISVSASRLETYSSCPFRHFIQRGIAADEPRKFQVDGRARGDIYHETLQELSVSLAPTDVTAVTDSASPWMTITEEECRDRVRDILLEKAACYREGVYESDGESRLKRDRIIETCGDIAWAMIDQVRKSSIIQMRFEEPFGMNGVDSDFAGVLPQMEFALENGRKAVLTGRIDRIDVMELNTSGDKSCDNSGSAKAYRVIDYKTGNAEISKAHIESGYKLQLMVYMNALGGKGNERAMEPAGAFYFKIRDYKTNADNDGTPGAVTDTVADRIANSCRLDGIFVGDEKIIYAMDHSLEPKQSSSAIPVKELKSGEIKCLGGSEMISPEEFCELCETTKKQVGRICREIQEGNIDISPKKERGNKNISGNQRTSCDYCSYKSICMFDTSFRKCNFEWV